MKIVFFFFCVWWIWNLIRFNVQISKLREIKEFYLNVLNIKDEEINNLGWANVSAKITETFNEYLQKSNDHRVRVLDAHKIANRIMRKENYMIALFNKDILDLSFPVFFGRQQMLTKLMEWALSYCILSFVWKENGQIRKSFLKERNSSLLTVE
jgi:autophagy-related protein 9